MALAIAASTLGLTSSSREARAFTQSGAGIDFLGNEVPMGHEWLTRVALLELIGGDQILKPDPNDPRKHWTRGKAKDTRVNAAEVARIKKSPAHDERYQATYRAVLDAIIGERWVDLAGFNVSNSTLGSYDCFDAVAQEPAEVQYDHFMRRYDDVGGEGGLRAAKESQNRFIAAFVNAAMAPETVMKVWDGGGYSSRVDVDRNYFLFGRALHLFEDSFSPEHTVRIPADNYERVRQVKSYLCAPGSEQHSHSNTDVLEYTSGDVIWKRGTRFKGGWAGYKPSNMKDVALVAVEAAKDAWAAFTRTMGTPISQRANVAHNEALTLVKNWMSVDDAEVKSWYQDQTHRDATYVLGAGDAGKGVSVSTCMKGLGVASGDQLTKVKELQQTQRICLYNVIPEPGYADLFDPKVHMPYNWQWRTGRFGKWEMPPPGWQIPNRAADTGVRVKIKNVKTGQYLSAPDGIDHNEWIYSKPGGKPILEFIMVGDQASAAYRLVNASLFLSYNNSTGAVKLWHSADGAWFSLEQSNTYKAIRLVPGEDYMYTRGASPYITRWGDPKDPTGQWVIDGLP